VRILFLTHAFNSLAQRLHVELSTRGHEVSVELDINDRITEEAVALHRPDVVIAPFLKRAIPASVWRTHRCLVVHPGIEGDRGPSALDWALMEGETSWGVTVLEATGEMDAGPVWSTVEFPMRSATKASLYRNEVTEAAVEAVLRALGGIRAGAAPRPLDGARAGARGRWRGAMRQSDRALDWIRDDTTAIVRKIRAADGFPGVRDDVEGLSCMLFDAHPEATLAHAGAQPGAIFAQRAGAVCRATIDGAVWITHMKRADDPAA
jgi:putative two-component system hydrogenase maturation factor HypX/HoxX